MGVVGTAKVVTSSESRNRPKSIQPGSREWVIPAFIIFKGKIHLRIWYEEDVPKDWVIGLSDNGWTTNDLGFDWIQHFDHHTKNRTIGKYRLLILDGHESQ
jgi:hypothetical protein